MPTRYPQRLASYGSCYLSTGPLTQPIGNWIRHRSYLQEFVISESVIHILIPFPCSSVPPTRVVSYPTPRYRLGIDELCCCWLRATACLPQDILDGSSYLGYPEGSAFERGRVLSPTCQCVVQDAVATNSLRARPPLDTVFLFSPTPPQAAISSSVPSS